MQRIFLILLLQVFTIGAFAEDGWPKPKNGGYFKLGQWWLIGTEHFTDQGLIDPNVTNGIYFTNVYGEYGVTDRLTAVVYFPFFARTLFNNTVSGTTGEILEAGEAVNSIGDIDLGIRYGLVQKGSFALSAGLTLGIPSGRTGGGSDGALQTGDGEFNQLVTLEAGQGLSFGKVNGFTKAHIGFNNRTQGFSDEFRFGIEAGATIFNEKVTLIARLFGIESFQNGVLPSQSTGTSIFANNTEHLTFGPEVAYHFNKNFGLSAGLAKPLSGRLIYSNTAYNVGVFYQW